MSPVVSGQHQDLVPDSASLTHEQLLHLESLVADSVEVGAELNVPNVFTPNGDGVNDHFEVLCDGATIYEFTIFTRTGNRVFHSLSPRLFWDGKNLAGYDMPEGIYYYVIEETDSQEGETSAGTIHLFR
jgi:gliding motility-associated-like protein